MVIIRSHDYLTIFGIFVRYPAISNLNCTPKYEIIYITSQLHPCPDAGAGPDLLEDPKRMSSRVPRIRCGWNETTQVQWRHFRDPYSKPHLHSKPHPFRIKKLVHALRYSGFSFYLFKEDIEKDMLRCFWVAYSWVSMGDREFKHTDNSWWGTGSIAGSLNVPIEHHPTIRFH